MEEDNACEIVNGESDAQSCINVNKILTEQKCELLRKARQRAKRNNIYIKVIW